MTLPEFVSVMLKKLIDFEAYHFPYLYVSAMPSNNVMLPGLSNFRCSTPFERLMAIKITNLCFKPKLSLLVISFTSQIVLVYFVQVMF